jgi:hypothetical protein
MARFPSDMPCADHDISLLLLACKSAIAITVSSWALSRTLLIREGGSLSDSVRTLNR